MASIRKRLDRPKPWEAVYRDPDGRQRTRSFSRKVDAQRFLTTVEADKLRGSYIDPAAGRVTFAAFAAQWAEAATVDAKTRDTRASHLRAHLLPAFGGMELRAIRPSTVQRWLAAASRDLAPSSVRVVLATLSTILAAAVDDDLIVKNPCRSRSVQAPPLPGDRVQPFTVDQVRRIIAALPERYRATASVAAGCGLRQGETFGLRVADVDFLRHRVDVRQQIRHVSGQGRVVAPPKRGKARTVPLPETVAAALAEHLRAFPADRDGLAFTNPKGGPIAASTYACVWKPAVVAAGLEPSRENGFHALRHHYASVLLEAGVSIRALADYLGHSDPGFTLRVYTHLMPAAEDRARQAVDAAYSCEPPVSQVTR